MDTETLHILRKSFAAIEDRAEITALIFYKRLFEAAPHLRPMFKGDIREQAAKLTEMIALGLSLAERPLVFDTEMRELGARHVEYGVQDEQYALVGNILLATLEEVLGDQFTPEIRAVWAQFYDEMCDAALAGAAAARIGNAVPNVRDAGSRKK
jgi:hemoglobin-like flavoprotein